jgi:hypothetical protein
MLIIIFYQITGPLVKKDASVIDKEDSRTIKKLTSMEPRKKYALIHEQIGIYVIGKKQSFFLSVLFFIK